MKIQVHFLSFCSVKSTYWFTIGSYFLSIIFLAAYLMFFSPKDNIDLDLVMVGWLVVGHKRP